MLFSPNQHLLSKDKIHHIIHITFSHIHTYIYVQYYRWICISRCVQANPYVCMSMFWMLKRWNQKAYVLEVGESAIWRVCWIILCAFLLLNSNLMLSLFSIFSYDDDVDDDDDDDDDENDEDLFRILKLVFIFDFKPSIIFPNLIFTAIYAKEWNTRNKLIRSLNYTNTW